MKRKNIFIILGSASLNSANQKLMEYFIRLTEEDFKVTLFDELRYLPHFDPEQSLNNPPDAILAFRHAIELADGVLICTPEYVFSIPAGLKNAIEWCVATTVFSDKPCGLITASSSGEKGHEELKLIMSTLSAKLSDDTSLLISGIKAAINENGELKDKKTNKAFLNFIASYRSLLQAKKNQKAR